LNRLLTVVEAFRDRNIEGVLPYSLKYCGAQHTGRFSGDTGLNVQNLPKKPLEGVDARGFIVPREGYKFIISDYSAIEPRVLAWLSGNRALLELLAKGMDIYEAHARATMGYRDPRPLKEVDPQMRQLSKVRVLGMGYGLGPWKFMSIYKQWTGEEISAPRAETAVNDFRSSNPQLVNFWRRLDRLARNSVGGEMEVELPSGRTIIYRDVCMREGDVVGRPVAGEPHRKLYGGLLTENSTQATAREILCDGLVRMHRAGLRVVLHVHDEVVVEVKEDQAEDAKRQLEEIMATAPDWMPGLPLACEAKIADRYGK
jgi:DNA polymerase